MRGGPGRSYAAGMRTLVVVENLSLDGVMPAPGREDDDERGGFTHGGVASRLHTELEPIRTQAFGSGAVVVRDRVAGATG